LFYSKVATVKVIVNWPGALCFFFKHDCTYSSSFLKVDGFNVSKSISISSELESCNVGSRDWIIVTTRPSLSPVERKQEVN
jgi:hypothetical protein